MTSIIQKPIFFISLLLSFAVQELSAQIGGRYVYEFVGLPASARLTALGGHLIAVADDDVNLATSNPASLQPAVHQSLAFNHNFHFSGVSNGHLAYGHHLKKYDITVHGGWSYISYGDFVLADEFGNAQGQFTGNENALTFGAAKTLNERIRVGANVKALISSLETYRSFGMAADLGISYISVPDKTIFSFVVKNLGGELATYADQRGKAPLDIQIGLSNRLKHLPFRYSITAHQLQQWNIRYDDGSNENTDIFGNVNETSAFNKSLDNLFRHLIFSGEFLIGKRENFRLRFSYNHLRKRELSSSEFRSLAGFGLGFGIKVSKFRLDYGVGYHHLVGANNHLTISTNLKEFKKTLAE